MTIILTNDAGGAELPQTRVVVAAHSDQVRRVGTEGAVPHPALVVVENRVAGQGPAFFDYLGDGTECVRGRGGVGTRVCQGGVAVCGREGLGVGGGIPVAGRGGVTAETAVHGLAERCRVGDEGLVGGAVWVIAGVICIPVGIAAARRL